MKTGPAVIVERVVRAVRDRTVEVERGEAREVAPCRWRHRGPGLDVARAVRRAGAGELAVQSIPAFLGPR
jgi:hypothetical protein